jgi:hypothetical protein
MDPGEEAKLKASFSTAANALTAFFKTSRELQSESYYFGKRDAFEDIVNFIVKESKGDVKHLNVNSLLEFIESQTVQLRETVSDFEKKRLESLSPQKKSEDINMGPINNLPTPLRNYASELEQNSNSGQNYGDLSSEMGLNSENTKYKPFGNN